MLAGSCTCRCQVLKSLLPDGMPSPNSCWRALVRELLDHAGLNSVCVWCVCVWGSQWFGNWRAHEGDTLLRTKFLHNMVGDSAVSLTTK